MTHDPCYPPSQTCSDGLKCVEMHCPLLGLDSDAVMVLHSRLWNATFLEVINGLGEKKKVQMGPEYESVARTHLFCFIPIRITTLWTTWTLRWKLRWAYATLQGILSSNQRSPAQRLKPNLTVTAVTARATSEQSHIVPFNLHSRASRTHIPVLSPCVNDLPPVIVLSSDKSDSFPWEKDRVHCQSCLVDHLSDSRRFAPDLGHPRLLHVEGKSKFVCALWEPLGLLWCYG